jgi:hypothetical protein
MGGKPPQPLGVQKQKTQQIMWRVLICFA